MDELVKSFFTGTREMFQFLDQQYGYRWMKEYIKHLGEGRDARALSEYVGSHVGIRISWSFANVIINVTFFELFQPGVFPKDSSFFPQKRTDVSKAISLYSLAEIRGTLRDPDFLLKDIEKPRSRYKRARVLQSHLYEVLAGLAQATQTYATPILQGDTSIFPEVMEYELKKHRQRHPDMFIPGLKQQDDSSQ